MSEIHLDCRHLFCPIPVIRTQNTIQSMAPGEILRVVCTDPGALHDIPAWCRIHKHLILDTQREDREIFIRIKVGAAPPS